METPIETGRLRIEPVGDGVRVTLGPQRRWVDWIRLLLLPIFLASCVDSARELISERVPSDGFPFVAGSTLIFPFFIAAILVRVSLESFRSRDRPPFPCARRARSVMAMLAAQQRTIVALVLALPLGCADMGKRSHVLFDDFTYASTNELASHGWIMRTSPGWPGVPGALWGAESFSLDDDPSLRGNKTLRMSSLTSGKGARTRQAQLCHERKYLEGTYAARVRFTDDAARGRDGDQIVETFYLISPLKAPMDPDYSEIDFEYRPNGGWGHTEPSLRSTTWETFQTEPMIDDNVSTNKAGELAGFHTLVVQVASGTVRYFLDGRALADHEGRFYPEAPMSINFNLWFIEEGVMAGSDERQYEEDIDWVFFRRDDVLSPDAVASEVTDMRRRHVKFRDTVPPSGLPSPCDF